MIGDAVSHFSFYGHCEGARATKLAGLDEIRMEDKVPPVVTKTQGSQIQGGILERIAKNLLCTHWLACEDGTRRRNRGDLRYGKIRDAKTAQNDKSTPRGCVHCVQDDPKSTGIHSVSRRTSKFKKNAQTTPGSNQTSIVECHAGNCPVFDTSGYSNAHSVTHGETNIYGRSCSQSQGYKVVEKPCLGAEFSGMDLDASRKGKMSSNAETCWCSNSVGDYVVFVDIAA
ncbi:hypothetical protein B0H11DRAFT_1899721 [Mycena galericulata]|nr:hypothetical protein B0H11DRAFT_1917466 [Mycena galericulata]KAJ7511256.1 hypothetical protein B0H11DRAFT_1899721 [Mycena galericulata]